MPEAEIQIPEDLELEGSERSITRLILKGKFLSEDTPKSLLKTIKSEKALRFLLENAPKERHQLVEEEIKKRETNKDSDAIAQATWENASGKNKKYIGDLLRLGGGPECEKAVKELSVEILEKLLPVLGENNQNLIKQALNRNNNLSLPSNIS